MDKTAKWIHSPQIPMPLGKAEASPEFRREFKLDALPETALLAISGVGFFDAKLNGKPVTDRLLTPPFTAYDKRVYFEEYDVSSLLQIGTNELIVQLAGGWFSTSIRDAWQFEAAPWKGTMQMIASLTADGVCILTTDSTWQARKSRMAESELRGGEIYDATMPEDDWKQAIVARGPGGKLEKYDGPGILVSEILNPVADHAVEGGRVYDFGVNLAGNCELTVSGPKGSRIIAAYGERLYENGELDTENSAMFCWDHRFQTDEYVLAGGGEESWHGLFTYHGFRYVKVTGDAQLVSIKARVFHTELPQAGGFTSDNPVLNAIQAALLRATKTNYHHMPTDCPHREKNGWTGDASLSCEQALFNLNIAPAYKKWLKDIDDAQRPSGALPGIVPTGGWGFSWGNGVSWDSVVIEIPWQIYWYTGDARILNDHYETMERYVNYMASITENGISTIGLGDWCPTKNAKPFPTEALLTGISIYVFEKMAQIAKITGHDEQKYLEWAQQTRKVFADVFLDKVPDSQAYLAMLLYLGLTDDRADVTRRLVREVREANGHFLGGIFGAKYILEALTDAGEFYLAYEIATQKDYPGWYHMLSNGSGTLWEDWEGENSLNHHMYSAIGAWFYKGIAGIHVEEAGYKKVRIAPNIPADMKFFEAWHDAPMGRLTVEWKDGVLTVSAPKGMEIALDSEVPSKIVRV